MSDGKEKWDRRLGARIANAQAEREAMRTEASVMIGIGLSMVKAGLTELTFTLEEVNQFNSKYRVTVDRDLPAGPDVLVVKVRALQ